MVIFLNRLASRLLTVKLFSHVQDYGSTLHALVNETLVNLLQYLLVRLGAKMKLMLKLILTVWGCIHKALPSGLNELVDLQITFPLREL